MKVLWIVNTALGPLGEVLYGKKENGKWMDALLESFRNNEGVDILITTTGRVKQTQCITEDNIKYFVLPNTPPNSYNEDDKNNILCWKELLTNENPDLIHVWGTEFTHGLCALRAAGNIPAVIYVQGYLRSIARHYYAGMTEHEIKRSLTFRDVIKQDSIKQQRDKYIAATYKEREMFERAKHIITENSWCEDSIRAVVSNVINHKCALSINKVFSEHEWGKQGIERHSIICTASGYPLKGLHMMLKALAILKEEFPDVVLYVPGVKVVVDHDIKSQLRKSGYSRYIESLIEELDLEKHVIWLGMLSQDQLAAAYETKNVFVLSSSIENHSSSLKEAMMVGTPCVASAVGGIPEYVDDGVNALLYRFEEYEVLAMKIKLIFTQEEMAKTLSRHAKTKMRNIHNEKSIHEQMLGIYNEVLDNWN